MQVLFDVEFRNALQKVLEMITPRINRLVWLISL
jgi:hypothetical protein